MKKIFFCVKGLAFLILLVFAALSLSVGAYAEDDIGALPEEYYGMLENIPDEVADRLPDEMYSGDAESIGEALTELTSSEYIFSLISELFGSGIGDALGVAARLCGILLISAVFASFKKSLNSEALSKAVGFCSSCAVFAAVIDMQYEQLSMVEGFFERLNSLFLGMIPVTGAIYAMGGNISTAAAGNTAMYTFLAVSERICASTIIPISCVCTALALCRGVAHEINLQGISSGIKKCYVFVLGMIMTILTALLAAQTTLTAAADSTAARAAKMVTSSMIPHVGGSVSDTLRTVASSVQYMKGIVGVSGIIFIVILLLPTLISLILTRFAFSFSGCVADLLGCEGESKLIGELGQVYGCMIAAVAMSSVMFILALNIFIKTTVALL